MRLAVRVFALITLVSLYVNPLHADTYELTFDALWSATEHPTNFPSNAHYSPIIGASHSEAMTIWSSGSAASQGVENVAETGDRTVLETMIDGSPNVLSKIVYPSGFDSPGTVGPVTFEVSDDYPLVSFVSMIAPSPDWFVGVNRLDLRSGGSFVDTLSVDLFAYDAGTEDGTMFGTDNPATDPLGVITMVDQAAYFGGTGPVARATLTRVVPEPSSHVMVALSLLGITCLRRRRK